MNLPNGFFPISTPPPNQFLDVIDNNGIIWEGIPVYYPFRLNPIFITGDDLIDECDPTWSGEWMIKEKNGLMCNSTIIGWQFKTS